jgi:hypothetical protein
MAAGGQEWEPTARTNMTVHSDTNAYANNTWVPFMRPSWNPNNTLDQWRERFGEDMNSRLLPVRLALKGTAFSLLSTEGLDFAEPLPESVAWRSPTPTRVGAARTQFP